MLDYGKDGVNSEGCERDSSQSQDDCKMLNRHICNAVRDFVYFGHAKAPLQWSLFFAARRRYI
jgi:hypothetical protein